jgi:hypothetical protein
MKIWPVVANAAWQQKKQKYKKALLYMVTEVLHMPQKTAERVLFKKGEIKTGWRERVLTNDCQFTHRTTATSLTELDPYRSREFCYPHEGMWNDWPANEFVFCKPDLDPQIHKQKDLSTFGGRDVKFTVPGGTPYLSDFDIAQASGQIAFYHKLRLTNGRATALPPT